MTTTMEVQLTAGQKCLLDLLQRKLFNTIQSYARLSLEKQKNEGTNQETDNIEDEMLKLKEKIRRISARQKRFTLEIINGNGNNTIPKESFFEALGLVTKEALNKLNSKSNERRRRTTANPRFSHEAIQAKRALEPLTKRLEPRVKGENTTTKRESNRKTNQQTSNKNQSSLNNGNNNIITNNSSNNSIVNNNINNETGKGGGTATVNQQALNNKNNNKTSGRHNNINSNNRSGNEIPNIEIITHNERMELLARFGSLQKEINSRVSKIRNKKENNAKLLLQNQRIRQRGLEIINAINIIDPNFTFHDCYDQDDRDKNSNDNNHNIDNMNALSTNSSNSSTSSNSSSGNTSSSNSNNNNNLNNKLASQSEPGEPQEELVTASEGESALEPIDLWIDMKCDESLDGID